MTPGIAEALFHPARSGATAFEVQGARFEAGAPVTGAIALGAGVAAGFGDGVVRFFHPSEPPKAVDAHRGVVLDLAADPASGGVLTGGDDGRFLTVSPDGTVAEIASFGTRWVDCVAAAPDLWACSSGSRALVWRKGSPDTKGFEHPSTVGGLAFDPKGRRLAAGHYGGATLWERGDRRWKAKKLAWRGSHGAVVFSPDGKYLVSSMQENALHGWRLRDKADMRMSGYPAKVKSLAWIGTGPFLATSGAKDAVCWPFDGKDGPMGRPPETCAHGGGALCTAVTGVVGQNGVVAGFADGSVLAGRLALDVRAEDRPLKAAGGARIAALALTAEGWLFVGDEDGRILWAHLGAAIA